MLGNPVRSGDTLITENWTREDGKSKAYRISNFIALYGSGELVSGTYVGEKRDFSQLERATDVKVVAIPRGNPGNDAKREQRSATHSALETTGIFLPRGEEVSITVLEDTEELNLAIGMYGKYSRLDAEAEYPGIQKYELTKGTYTFKREDSDGMVYIENRSYAVVNNIQISGGIEIPRFVLNSEKYTEKYFSDKVEETNGVLPFFEIEGKYSLGTIQTAVLKELEYDTENRLVDLTNYWDEVYTLTNEAYGFNQESGHMAYKNINQRIHYVTPDTGAGWASATSNRLNFQLDSGAARSLVSKKKETRQWGVWHEVGHTYQNNKYQFPELVEITVNFSSAYINQYWGFEDVTVKAKEKVKDYLAKPKEQKNYHDLVDGTDEKLAFFVTLQRVFGKDFFPTLAQVVRTEVESQLPLDDEQKVQRMMQVLSKTANRNLLPYFTEWGLYADDTTQAFCEAYPPLEKEIWKDIAGEDERYDLPGVLPKYTVPTVESKNKLKLPLFGDISQLEGDLVSHPIAVQTSYGDLEYSSMGQGGATLKLTNEHRVPNIISIEATGGNTIKIFGNSGAYQFIGTNPVTKQFRVVGKNGNLNNSSFVEQQYISIKHYDADFKTIKSKVELNGSGNQSDSVAIKDVFNGKGYEVGDFFVIRHEEPSRIDRYWKDSLLERDSKNTYIYRLTNYGWEPVEAKYWGEAAWDFEEKTGTLVVESGVLGSATESPWNRKDNLKIDSNKIKKIKLIGENEAPLNSTNLFSNLLNLETIDGLEYLNTTDTVNMSNMFSNNIELHELDISSFNTSKVTNMNRFFSGLKLEKLALGEHFRFIESNSLGAPIVGEEGVTLTGKWVREDGKSKAYTPSEFTSLYGSGDLTPGVYVAEILGSVWGDAPWTFEEESGLLTVGSGNLGLSGESPWNRKDNLKIAADKIKKIKLTGKNVAPVNSSSLFGNLKNVETIEGLSNLDTSNVENMSSMFALMSSISTLDVSHFDTRKVTNMNRLFNGVGKVETVDITSFNTLSVTDMGSMFSGMKLKSLKLGEHFRFIESNSLGGPIVGEEGVTLTGKWVREDGKSKGYTPTEFTSLYGSGDLTPGVYVAEILGSVWGDAPWTFEEESGLLTVGSGNLGLSGESPWNRKDNLQVNFELIKKIKFTGKAVAPANSTRLFSRASGGLSKLESFEGLSNLDTSKVENMSYMFNSSTALRQLDISSFDTRKVTSMSLMFNTLKLEKLVLGEHFRFGDSSGLNAPLLQGAEGTLTGKWIREDKKSRGYLPAEFMMKYGTDDLTAGVYVAEIKVPKASIQTHLNVSPQDSSLDVNIIGKLSFVEIEIENDSGEEGSIARNLLLTEFESQFEIASNQVKVKYEQLDGTSNEKLIPKEELKTGSIFEDISKGDRIKISYEGIPWNNSDQDSSDSDLVQIRYYNGQDERYAKISETIKIESGNFGFANVPALLEFKTKPLLSHLTDQMIDRVDDKWGISVEDYRGTNERRAEGMNEKRPERQDWVLVATADLFKDRNNKEISPAELATVYVKDGVVLAELSDQEILIENHSVENETPKENHEVKVNWGVKDGIKARVHNKNELKSNTQYQAVLNFELRVAP